MILVYTQRHPRGYQFSWKPRAWHWFHINKPFLEADGSRWSLLEMDQLSHRQQGLTALLGAGATDVFFFLLPMWTTRCAWLRFCRDRWGSLLLITLKVHYHGLLQFYGWKKQNKTTSVLYVTVLCILHIYIYYYFFYHLVDLVHIDHVAFAACHHCWWGGWVRSNAIPQLRVWALLMLASCSVCWSMWQPAGLRGTHGDVRIATLPISCQWPPTGRGSSGSAAGAGDGSGVLLRASILLHQEPIPCKDKCKKKHKRNVGSKWNSGMCQLLAPRQSSCIFWWIFLSNG